MKTVQSVTNIALILEKMKRWLIKRKVRISQHSRINQYLKYFESASEYKGKPLIELYKNLPNLELHNVALDVMLLVLTSQNFKFGYLTTLQKEKWDKAINGTPNLKNELSDKTARNYLFELYIESLALAASIKVMPSLTDVVIKKKENKLLIECKRITSIDKIAKNINRAVEQIEMRIDDNSLDVIALSIEKIINSKCENLSSITMDDSEAFTDDLVHKFYEEYVLTNKKFVDSSKVYAAIIFCPLSIHIENDSIDTIAFTKKYVFTKNDINGSCKKYDEILKLMLGVPPNKRST